MNILVKLIIHEQALGEWTAGHQ